MDQSPENSDEALKTEQCEVDLAPYQKLLTENNENSDGNKQMSIEFVNLKYSVECKKGNFKDILREVSGRFLPGRLTAILGPSGAGKTSLLNILAGRKKIESQGCIIVNGMKISYQTLQKHCCYIPQEFALMPLLTVKETLLIAAELKLNNTYDARARELIVNEIVNKLNLNECWNSIVQRLSGGEKKRLSIGLEVITSPSVLLLDEPTSGLDSVSSKQVIELLHSLAQTGCTIICSIHQPSSQLFSLFDDIIILGQGKCYYCGPRDNIVDTFSEAGFICPNFYNIAEFVLEVITERRAGDLSILEKLHTNKERENIFYDETVKNNKNNENRKLFIFKNLENEKDSNVESRRYAVSNWVQLKVLLRRSFICIRRDNTLTKLRYTTHLVVALLLGIVFYKFGEVSTKIQSNIACIFFILLFLFFANSMPAVQMFPTETAVFVRENSNNWYSLHVYYISKVVSDLPLQILCPTSLLLIVYYLTGQPCEVTRFVQSWIICVLFTILAQSMGIVTGAAFNTDIGMFLIPALNIPMFLFSGFFLKFSEMPYYFRFISELSYFRYAFEGILQAIYGSNRRIFNCTVEMCITPGRILSQLNMPSVTYLTTNLALIAWTVVLHFTIYFVLRWKLYIAAK
ncbi:ATP-binding cassette sub-family G member 4-like [Leptopilina heterotoma]|uniref:ATP-binding cassette sub-family G member 4-like n=1 Tax=Leptopilina heterotoma TaxID=63436 RepID=UPI001CA8F161|nr:ATP-binding cassette sub-family G member 4-like [Leptopilina heterotoma]